MLLNLSNIVRGVNVGVIRSYGRGVVSGVGSDVGGEVKIGICG